MTKNINFKVFRIFFILLIIVLIETIFLTKNESIKNLEANNLQYSPLNKCKNPNEKIQKLQCWEELIDSALKNQGVDKAFEIVEILYSSEPDFANDCHAFVHKIGEKAYKLFSNHQDFPLSPRTSYCGYGFYHAFMESLLRNGGDLNKAKQFCDYVDEQMGNTIADAKGACYHGIGHGTADNHNIKFWKNEEELVVPALKLCLKVAPDERFLNRCASGVFNVMAINYNSHKLTLNASDPLWFCRQQENQVFKKTCYEEMNTALFALSRGEFIKAAKFIEGIYEDEYANSGIRSLAGVLGMSLVKNLEFTKTFDDCRTLQQRLRLSCIKGFVGGLIEGGQPHQEYIKALKFCADHRLSEDEKAACYEETLWLSSQYYPKEKYQQICEEVDEKFRKNCNS